MRIDRGSELTEGIDDKKPFYFVHTYASQPAEESVVIGTAEHGERFVAAIAKPPLYGVQFHPEKSGPDGLALLRNFVRLTA